MQNQMNSNGRPIVFGEVVFDILPDGKEILGGAPLNVAWHLQAFGYHPLVISRVGSDARGNLIRETMKKWGMDIRGLQVDPLYPTGVVHLFQEDSRPSFRIEPNQAYDYISLDDTIASLNNDLFFLILHGTLALRSTDSHKALEALREKLGLPIFADINLRTPWWNPSVVKETLKNARWVKVNDHELQTIFQTESSSSSQHHELARQLIRQYKNIELLFITLGVEGSFAVTQNGEAFHEKGIPIPASELKDTVGAGDAFTAITIIGLLEEWKIDVILQRANRFAGAMCRIPGATTTNRDLYEAQLKSWTTE